MATNRVYSNGSIAWSTHLFGLFWSILVYSLVYHYIVLNLPKQSRVKFFHYVEIFQMNNPFVGE